MRPSTWDWASSANNRAITERFTDFTPNCKELTMPTFVYMTSCDGCGHCVDICPSDIMHIDPTYRRAYNIEPDMCWECYACVKACPQNAIDVRGYADFAPLGHSVRVLRDEEKGTISWKVKFRNGTEKNFLSPITTKPWGECIPQLKEVSGPSEDMRDSQHLYSEPKYIRMDEGEVHTLQSNKLKMKLGVYY
jgi:adenylylsulfate reductase subunit B